MDGEVGACFWIHQAVESLWGWSENLGWCPSSRASWGLKG